MSKGIPAFNRKPSLAGGVAPTNSREHAILLAIRSGDMRKLSIMQVSDDELSALFDRGYLDSPSASASVTAAGHATIQYGCP
jgi:hypothetical protein